MDIPVGAKFSYNCRPAVKAAIEHMVAPVVIGLDSGDIAGISRDMQEAASIRTLRHHDIPLSALDIALWDIAGKRAGLPWIGC